MTKILVDDVYLFEYETSKLTADAFAKMLKECEVELMETKKATHVRFEFAYLDSSTGACEIRVRFKRPERMKEKMARVEKNRENAKKKKSLGKRKYSSFSNYVKDLKSGKIKASADFAKWM